MARKRSPGTALVALERVLEELGLRFVEPHRTVSLEPPSRDQVWDFRAYVVLVHAEFEQYFEDSASWLLEHADRRWLRNRVVSAALLSAALRAKAGLAVEKETIRFEAMRAAVAQVKEVIGRDIHQENHGIALKHLKKMFWSLGVELPDDAGGMGSVEKLSAWRGAQAHHAIGAETVPAARDLLQVVSDCLKVAGAIRRACVLALGTQR